MSEHRSQQRREAKADFERRMAEISRREFVTRILDLVPHAARGGASAVACRVRRVQNDGTGPATLEYRFAGGPRVFGKLYRDASGAHCASVLRGLWSDGFGGSSGFQVARPLAFLKRLDLLVTLEAPGTPVSESLAGDGAAALEGVRDAARWLSRLHGRSQRWGRRDGPWYIFLKLADRLSKAAAAHPDEVDRLKKIAVRLRGAQEAPVRSVLVQSHGQFRPIHVFRGPETTAVIDLDRSCPADPGRDLAEFIHRMRTGVFRTTGDRARADTLTRAFLATYAEGPVEGFGKLPFHHGFNVSVSLCRHMKRPKTDPDAWKKEVSFYTREFKDAVSGRFIPG